MKCLVLAAGYATRLYPLTENFPKPLLKIGEKTILDYLIDDVSSCKEIDEFIIISNGRFACFFDEWAKKKTQKITVVDDGTFSNETRLGAVGDIKFAIDKLSINDDILVIAGDNVLDFSLTEFIGYALKKKTSCVMRYFEADKNKIAKSGELVIDENGKVIAMHEKPANPVSNWCCPPFYYYTAEDVSRISEALDSGCGYDAPGAYVEWLCDKSDVHAMEMPGKRFDIGTLENYHKVCEEYNGLIR